MPDADVTADGLNSSPRTILVAMRTLGDDGETVTAGRIADRTDLKRPNINHHLNNNLVADGLVERLGTADDLAVGAQKPPVVYGLTPLGEEVTDMVASSVRLDDVGAELDRVHTRLDSIEARVDGLTEALESVLDQLDGGSA